MNKLLEKKFYIVFYSFSKAYQFMGASGIQLLKLQFKSFTRKTTPLGNERISISGKYIKCIYKNMKISLELILNSFEKINNLKFFCAWEKIIIKFFHYAKLNTFRFHSKFLCSFICFVTFYMKIEKNIDLKMRLEVFTWNGLFIFISHYLILIFIEEVWMHLISFFYKKYLFI